MVREMLGAVACRVTPRHAGYGSFADISYNNTTVRDKSSGLVMTTDATGLKQHSRGEHTYKKWQARRVLVRLHLMIDADTGQVPAAVVTDEAGSKKIQCHRMPIPVQGCPHGF